MQKENKNTKYQVIDNIDKLKKLCIILKKNIFVISLHAININSNNISILGLIFSTQYNQHWYCLCQPEKNKNFPSNFNLEAILKILKPVLENKKYFKIGKNIKFIFHIFKKYNITLQGIKFDTLIVYYLFNPIYKFYNELKTLFQQYDNKNEYNNIKKIIKNSYVSYKIYIKSKLYFQQAKKQKEIFKCIDMPLVSILAIMESYGILIKKEILQKQTIKNTNTLRQLKKNIYQIVGEKFNINSTKKIQEILFKKYQLPVIKKTKKGKNSTDEQVLKILSTHHPLPKILLKYRTINKLNTTYLKKLPQMINSKTGRIHTTYNQFLTSTGRLSSSKPNLQNIPIRTQIGKKIRTAFITQKKWILLTADYSQIELRILAHYSQDKKLISEFFENCDLHYATALNIFNLKKTDKIKKIHRNIGKIVNFSIMYGISAFGLSKQLNISLVDAQKYIKKYFFKYFGVKKYIHEIHKKTEKKKYIKTLFSRKIYIPNITSYNKVLKNSAKRFCINALIQSTAADIIKKSMINIHHLIQKKYHQDAKLIMQIHDELVFEIKKEKKEKISIEIKRLMENCVTLKVPLKASINIGKNWGSLKEIL